MRNAKLTRLLLSLLLLLVATALFAAPPADSVILFIGDGMGANHIAVAQRFYGRNFAMARLGYKGVATTLNAQGGLTDSAAASTALATGFKTDNGKLCLAPDGRPLESILERCQQIGKSTGVVTTDQLTGATPAGFVVQVASRRSTAEIADQMLGSGTQVMLGGGAEADYGEQLETLRQAGYGVVSNRDELLSDTQPKLLGLFGKVEMPALSEMTQAAINRLAANPKGFFLVVEQAKMDWDHNLPKTILNDMRELDGAVAVALNYARTHPRMLVIVTGDHETGGLSIRNPYKISYLRLVRAPEATIAARLNASRTNVAQVMASLAGMRSMTRQEISQIQQASDPAIAIGNVLSARAGLAWTSNGQHTTTPVRILATGAGAMAFASRMDNTDIPKRIATTLGITTSPASVTVTESGELAWEFAQ